MHLNDNITMRKLKITFHLFNVNKYDKFISQFQRCVPLKHFILKATSEIICQPVSVREENKFAELLIKRQMKLDYHHCPRSFFHSLSQVVKINVK
jgi:hypothetical protein